MAKADRYKVNFTCAYAGGYTGALVNCEASATSDKEAKFIAYQATREELNTEYIKVVSPYNTIISSIEQDESDAKVGTIYSFDIEQMVIDRSIFRIYNLVVKLRLKNEIYEIKYKVGAVNETKARAQAYTKIRKLLGISDIWFYRKTESDEIENYTIEDILGLEYEYIKIREIKGYKK